MTKAELESKSLSDLHSLAAEAGVERYRMLSRAELVEKLGGGGSGAPAKRAPRQSSSRQSRPAAERGERPPQRRRRRRSGSGSGGGGGDRERPRREPSRDKPRPEPRPPERAPEPTPAPTTPSGGGEAPSRPRRRRRRFGRRGKGEVSIQDLLLPPASGRQAILCAETRDACTALLRGVAADLAGASKGGPDPVVLLIDPSPEELAEWKREAPDAEIVAAGQARHASDALAQASARAGSGDDVILLVDSLTRLASAYGDADSAREFFDAGRVQGGAGGGSLTVLAALERPAS